jgi:hypothetical protein
MPARYPVLRFTGELVEMTDEVKDARAAVRRGVQDADAVKYLILAGVGMFLLVLSLASEHTMAGGARYGLWIAVWSAVLGLVSHVRIGWQVNAVLRPVAGNAHKLAQITDTLRSLPRRDRTVAVVGELVKSDLTGLVLPRL